jgi:hypothetical protein
MFLDFETAGNHLAVGRKRAGLPDGDSQKRRGFARETGRKVRGNDFTIDCAYKINSAIAVVVSDVVTHGRL